MLSAQTLAWLTVFIMTLGTIWYCRLIVLQRISPAPAAWIIAAVAMNLSFITYWGTPQHTLIGNITNLAAGIEILCVTTLLLFSLWRRGELQVSFDRFQNISLLLCVVIVVFWKQPFFFSAIHRSIASFIAVQALLVLSYVVMANRVLKLKKNPDSIVMWISIGTASISGFYAALERSDVYGQSNSLRAIISSVVLIAIMVYFDRRNGRWSSKHTVNNCK